MEQTMEEITAMLASISMLLATIDLDELGRHVTECKRSLSQWDSVGPIIDPTAYRDSLHSGRRNDAKNQLAIAQALLTARKAIVKRESELGR